MDLFLNWFKVDLSPASFTLPTKDYPTWEDSTAELDIDALKPFHIYRGRTGAESISIVLLDGPTPPPDWEDRAYTARTHRNVVAEIIKRALEEHFKMGKLITLRSNWGVTATRPVGLMASDAIRLSSGVSCKVYSPDPETGMGITVQWEVKAEFVKSLADNHLRAICEGLPVLLRYNPQDWQPHEKLRSFRNHYLGSVKRVMSNDTIEVLARDNGRYQLPADKLFIEAKPSTIKEYENRNTTVQAGRSVWRRIQELNYVLTGAGRRNTSVLQDRLNSIRRFLSPQGNDLLIMELPVYGTGQATLDMRPAAVQNEAG
jgi:hypothetical protein